jgi:hypothetical protein
LRLSGGLHLSENTREAYRHPLNCRFFPKTFVSVCKFAGGGKGAPGHAGSRGCAGRRHECALCMLHRYAALAPVECPALTACEPACAPSRGVSGHARTRSASPHTPCIHIHLMAASWGRHGLPTRSRSRYGFTRPPPGSYPSTARRARGGRASGIRRPHVWPTHPDHLWPLLSPCGSTRPVRASRKISIAADPPPNLRRTGQNSRAV